MKRFIDIVLSVLALIVCAPIVLIAAFMVWKEDRHWPFYTPWRVGRDHRAFRLFKLRSMQVGADQNAVDTTIASDPRITKLGHKIRRYKLDELPQFANVLIGDMSLVGPRPNIDREVQCYSKEESRMLEARPGITDLASIVFSDLAQVLNGVEDPNIAYNQLVRPWKSRLALFYLDHHSLKMDVRILWATFIAIFNSARARASVLEILQERHADQALLDIVARRRPLSPTPPPGMSEVVQNRNVESTAKSSGGNLL